MTELFLIAHKVRGEPAFDIAQQIPCPACAEEGIPNCHECDGLGFWWIIPTSGHRAYPWQSWGLDNLGAHSDIGFCPDLADPMPEPWPDHYTTRATPTISLTEALGIKPRSTPIVRRM